jgi:hypothetical protein
MMTTINTTEAEANKAKKNTTTASPSEAKNGMQKEIDKFQASIKAAANKIEKPSSKN